MEVNIFILFWKGNGPHQTTCFRMHMCIRAGRWNLEDEGAFSLFFFFRRGFPRLIAPVRGEKKGLFKRICVRGGRGEREVCVMRGRVNGRNMRREEDFSSSSSASIRPSARRPLFRLNSGEREGRNDGFSLFAKFEAIRYYTRLSIKYPFCSEMEEAVEMTERHQN